MHFLMGALGCAHGKSSIKDGFFYIDHDAFHAQVPVKLQNGPYEFYLQEESYDKEMSFMSYQMLKNGEESLFLDLDIDIFSSADRAKSYFKDEIHKDLKFREYKAVFSDDKKTAFYKGLGMLDGGKAYIRIGYVSFLGGDTGITFELCMRAVNSNEEKDFWLRDLYEKELIFNDSRLSGKDEHNNI